MAEIGRWLVSLGVVAAAVGFVVFGMSMAYAETVIWQKDVAEGLMAGGGLAIVIGLPILLRFDPWHAHRAEAPQTSQTRATQR